MRMGRKIDSHGVRLMLLQRRFSLLDKSFGINIGLLVDSNNWSQDRLSPFSAPKLPNKINGAE